MKRNSLLLILLMFFTSCNSQQIVEDQIKEQLKSPLLKVAKPTLAIYQVREEGKEYDTDVSLYWKEQIIQIFSHIPEIKLVARQQDLKFLMEEYRLMLSGITDDEELATKMGHLLSARFVMTATILQNGKLRYKIMDVSDGTIAYTGIVNLPNDMVEQSRTANRLCFPSEYYDNLIKVKSTTLLQAMANYSKKIAHFRVFSAVLSDHKIKNKWEKRTEEILTKQIIENGYRYQINLGSTELTFAKQKAVYKTLDYTTLYGKAPYLILFVSCKTDDETVRIKWSLVTHQLPVKTLCRDELVIEKN